MNRINLTLLLLPLFFLLSLPAWAADEAKEEKSKPAYFELQPSVVANLAKGGKHIRMDIQLMLSKEESLDEVKLHAPALVNEMLLLVSDQDGAELKTAKGKEAFRQSALKACNKVLDDLTGNEPVKDLFFTAFYVQ